MYYEFHSGMLVTIEQECRLVMLNSGMSVAIERVSRLQARNAQLRNVGRH